MAKITKIKDIVDWHLCTGCGACASYCKKQNAVKLANVPTEGIRPRFDPSICKDCTDCLQFCPGFRIEANSNYQETLPPHQDLLIGSYFDLWEGNAKNKTTQNNGSSGGIISALAVYCIEHENMKLVIHTGMDPLRPWANKTVLSRTAQEVLSHSGSRYCTSSPCELLYEIENSDTPCVFIGKPCDVAAVSRMRKVRPQLDKKLGIVLSFFCAGTPSTQATVELSQKLGCEPDKINTLQYRGQGWPGLFSIKLKEDDIEKTMTYMDSWADIARKRPFRCHFCPDGMGQLSDISAGDAWYKYDKNKANPGISHIITRTKKGNDLLSRAIKKGAIEVSIVTQDAIIQSQGLVDRRKDVFGRILAMKTFGIPTTKFRDFNLKQAWLLKPLRQRLQNIIGTQKRILLKKIWKKSPNKS